MENKPQVIIYTDGACSGNPGPGGWAAVLRYGETVKEISGYEAGTTNNRMELLAAISALELLNKPCRVLLYSDSAYLINAFRQRWVDNWQRNGWQTSQKKPVENKDLWLRLLAMADRHEITWHKVAGHSTDEVNNRCDELARAAIRQLRSEQELDA